MKRPFFDVTTVATLLLTFVSAATAQEITVAAASDLNFALKEITAKFQAGTGAKVKLTFGSSGNFFTAIRNGAPYDVFLSADKDYPQQLAAAGLTDGSPFEYASGKLVLWARRNSPIDVNRGWSALDAAHKIAIANPQHAPYGRAAVEAMKASGIYDRVRSKFVMGENISQAVQFVETGNAEIGVLALSLALSPTIEGKYWLIPQSEYVPLRQAAVVLKSSAHKDVARNFLEFFNTPDARAILKKYGFEN